MALDERGKLNPQWIIDDADRLADALRVRMRGRRGSNELVFDKYDVGSGQVIDSWNVRLPTSSDRPPLMDYQPFLDRSGEILIGIIDMRYLMLTLIPKKEELAVVELPCDELRFGGEISIIKTHGTGDIRLHTLKSLAQYPTARRP